MSEPSPPNHSPRVYIAEDDAYLREAYARRFARTPYRVATAANGIEAVAMVDNRAPDLLICDIMMPERDGWWVLAQFPPETRRFPILMLTNLNEPQIQARCTALGADGYFVKKDMSLHTLVAMAGQLLGQDRPAL